MTLLQVTSTIPCPESTFTDWVQAVGAIVAIIGVFYGFYRLFMDSKENKTQINTLTELAKESKIANQLFKSQIDEDKRRHKIFIRPRFTVEFSKMSFNRTHYTLQNVGDEARNIKINTLPESCVIGFINKSHFINYLLKGQTAEIIFDPKQKLLEAPSMDNFEVKAGFYFQDIDGNMYGQRIYGNHVEDITTTKRLHLNEPFEIESGSPESENFVY